MPNFREAYESLRFVVEQALGLSPAPSLDELQTAGTRADGAFSLELTWAPHAEHPGRWAQDHPGRCEGTLGVNWLRRVVPDAQVDTEAQIVADADKLVNAMLFGIGLPSYPTGIEAQSNALAEITVRFRGTSQATTNTREWRRGRCDFEFEHYYDAEAA